MKKLAFAVPILAVLAVVVGGPFLELDVDVFNLLPGDSRMVEGLKLYQSSFGSSRELIVSVRSPDVETTERATESLARALTEQEQLTASVIWRSPFLEDTAGMAELIAYLWFNQPAEVFETMAERFDASQLRPALDASLERMTTSLRVQDVARLSRDPYALTDLPEGVSGSAIANADDPFSSPDGTLRILFVQPPFESAGFWRVRDWVADTIAFAERWNEAGAPDRAVEIRITGDPAFMAEIGSGLLRDMQLAALGTLAIVAGLFWLAHRRLVPLVWLVVLLVSVLAITVVLGSLILGALNVAALGFAAILLGLAADYGLILYQEKVAHPERSAQEVRRIVAPSILWAAATTAGAFVMVSRSSLPGLTQLGLLVAIGISVAAVVMLIAFLPPLARAAGAGDVAAPVPGRFDRALATGRSGARAALWLTVVAVVVSLAILALRRPEVDTGTEGLGPRDAHALAALQEIHREIGGAHDPLWLIVSGSSEIDVSDRLARVTATLDGAVSAGVLQDFATPAALWPRPDSQAANREAARRIAARLPGAIDAAEEVGFTREALRLTEQVFASWDRFASRDGVAWPEHPGSRWVIDKFATRADGRFLALGRMNAAEEATTADLMRLSEEIDSIEGGRLIGWGLLSESLLGDMTRDVRRVLLPMGVVLLGILWLAFRGLREIVLSIATLIFSLLCLLGVMAILGWAWNLMNVMSLPLLFGAGVDYSIHIQLALRREGGDVVRVRQTVGRAILLCGTSTAVGFGTLAFASNAGVAGLGRVCAAGILIASMTSIFLLPAWWKTLAARHAGSVARETP